MSPAGGRSSPVLASAALSGSAKCQTSDVDLGWREAVPAAARPPVPGVRPAPDAAGPGMPLAAGPRRRGCRTRSRGLAASLFQTGQAGPASLTAESGKPGQR